MTRVLALFITMFMLLVPATSPFVAGLAPSGGTASPAQDSIAARAQVPMAPTSSVVINEYLPAPKDTYSKEWAELYNAGNTTADITGWYISDSLSKKHTFPMGTLIGPGSHVLVEKTLGLNNGGDEIRLFNSTGALVDSHAYDDSEYDRSWGRRPDGSVIWTVFSITTPGGPNPGPPRIVINELMVDPKGSDTDGEWLELLNNGSRQVDLGGWKLTDQDGSEFTFPSVIMPVGSYLVVREAKGTDDTDLTDGTGHVYTGKTSRWSNTGDDILLTDAGGVGIDYIAYGVSKYIDPPLPELAWKGRWWDKMIDNYTDGLSNLAVAEGSAMALSPDGADSDSPAGWRACDPSGATPGGGNDRSYGFTLSLREDSVNVPPGGHRDVEVVLHNTGNVGGYFDIRLNRSESGEGWWGELMYGAVELRPGERTAIEMSIGSPDLGMGDLCSAVTVNVSRRVSPAYADAHETARVEARMEGVDIAPTPLTVELDGVPAAMAPEGSLLDMTLKLENTGTDKGGQFTLALYLDEVRRKARVGRIQYESITPGYAKRPHFELDTLGIPGNHTIIAVADPAGSIAELDEDNNIAMVNLTILPTAPSQGDYAVKVAEAYPDTAVPEEPDEYVVLVNTGNTTVDISGWSIGEAGETDISRCAVIPSCIFIGPGERVVLAREAMAYSELTRTVVDMSCDMDDTSRRLVASRGWPTLSNAGDEVILRDGNRHIIDGVHYGGSTEVSAGWTGDCAPAPKEGTLLQRRVDAVGGYRDTNTSFDWSAGARPGRELNPSPAHPLEGSVGVIANGPAKDILAIMLNEAGGEVLVFASTSGELPDPGIVAAAAARGVAVTVTIAAQPGDASTETLDRLYHAGAEVLRIYLDRGSGGIPRQEGFAGGYAVIDGRFLCALPPPDDPLPLGGVMLDSPGAAEHMASVFRSDADPGWGDCERYVPASGGTGDTVDENGPAKLCANEFDTLCITFSNDALTSEGRVRPLIFPDAGDPGSVLVRELRRTEASLDIVMSHEQLHGKVAGELRELVERDVMVRLLIVPSGEDEWFDGAGSVAAPSAKIDGTVRMLCSDVIREEAGTNGPFWLAGLFRNTVDGDDDPSQARVLYDRGPRNPGDGGVMTVVDGHRVTWISGAALAEMKVGGAPGDLPRNVGLRVVGQGPAHPFGELFEALWNETPSTLPSGDQPTPLFSQVYYDTRVAGEPDESFAISNPHPGAADVSGWFVTDNVNGGGTYEGLLRLPPGTVIPPQGTLYVAREAEAFRETFSRYPHLRYGPDGDDTVPLAQTFGWGLTLTNTRDELFLLESQGRVVDTVVYGGDSRSVSGWSGPPIPLLPEGRLLKRASPECPSVSGSPLSGYADNDCGADWVSPRQYRPGQSAFLPETFTAGRLTTFVSPDSSFGALRDLIDGAQKSVRVAVYQLMNLHLVNLLCNASGRGVNVTVLLEGGPVGGVTPDQKAASAMLDEAGCTVLYLVSDSSSGVYARYDYVHAKYCVVDGESVAVMSENWVATGIPFHRAGNRGMGIIVHDKGVAGYFTEVFLQDTDIGRADVAAYDPGICAGGEAAEDMPGEGNSSRIQQICGPPPAGTDLEYRRPDLDHRPRFDVREFTGPAKITPVVSPDTSLHPGTIMGMLESAERSILVQQLEVSPNWTSRGRELPNLYLEALLDAARRGVEVKVLLDSAYVGRGEDFDNADMVEVLRAVAVEEDLDLEADLIHLTGAPGTHSELAKVHNKAIIVDSRKVLLSSINWVRGAALLNREAGLIVEHPGAARYYEDVFLHDWNLSVQRDLSMHITPGADITLLPGTTWELNLRISGTGGAMHTGPGLTNGTTLAVTIDLPAHEGGWIWGLGADCGRMAEVRVWDGVEVAVRLTVTAPDNPWASTGDVEVPVFAQVGGRRSCVGVLSLHVEWSESVLGAMGNLSLDLEGERASGYRETDDAGEPFAAIGMVMGLVFCLAVCREYAVRWWKGRNLRK